MTNRPLPLSDDAFHPGKPTSPASPLTPAQTQFAAVVGRALAAAWHGEWQAARALNRRQEPVPPPSAEPGGS